MNISKLSPAAKRVFEAAAQGQLFESAGPSPSPLGEGGAKRRVGQGLELDIFCDGASRGNPGPASAGAVLLQKGSKKVLAQVSQVLGRATNNEAEYAALLLALKKAQSLGATSVAVHADSELVIKQLNGIYRVKHPVMRERHQEAMRLLAGFKTWRAAHVPREQNVEADRLANLALDAS